MYVMGLGGKPVGECFFAPPDKEGVAWLICHYYAGGNVRLLQFKEPTESPEDGSVEKRIRDLEDDIFRLKSYTEKFFKDLCESTGVEYKTFEEYAAGITPPPHEDVSTEAGFLISSYDTYSAQRGW